jgi:hypothetical protein
MHSSKLARGAGAVAPRPPLSDERPGVTAQAFKVADNNGQPDSEVAPDRPQAFPADTSQLAALAAKAARVRCSVYPLAHGGFVVTRQAWGMSRELPDARSVGILLDRMAGVAP